MKIIVPIKQVPESSNVKMDPVTGTVIRAGVETVVNPLDMYALEAALRLKEQFGGTVTVVSMGPPPAIKALKEAIAMGCDDGMLVSDRKFGGSDTHATSYILAESIKTLGAFDLIVTGERATDGDTAQVGCGIASWLGIPVVTYVSKVEKGASDKELKLERIVEEGYQLLTTELPAVLCVVKAVATPRLPTLKGKKKSMELAIPTIGVDKMPGIDEKWLGLKGSPTNVVKIDTPKVTRSGKTIVIEDESSLNKALDELVGLLDKKGLIA
jgi:electron transfer flavoprotein beta subunit